MVSFLCIFWTQDMKYIFFRTHYFPSTFFQSTFIYLLLYLSCKENNIIGVLIVITSGNKRTRLFSEKGVFCKISGGSVILLGKYASNFIRIDPCYRLRNNFSTKHLLWRATVWDTRNLYQLVFSNHSIFLL